MDSETGKQADMNLSTSEPSKPEVDRLKWKYRNLFALLAIPCAVLATILVAVYLVTTADTIKIDPNSSSLGPTIAALIVSFVFGALCLILFPLVGFLLGLICDWRAG